MKIEDLCNDSHEMEDMGEENEEGAPVPTMNDFDLIF
jgi:hypothetical protein